MSTLGVHNDDYFAYANEKLACKYIYIKVLYIYIWLKTILDIIKIT